MPEKDAGKPEVRGAGKAFSLVSAMAFRQITNLPLTNVGQPASICR
jgi:hypothetical protein